MDELEELLERLPERCRPVVEAEMRARQLPREWSVEERAAERAELWEVEARHAAEPRFRSFTADIATRMF